MDQELRALRRAWEADRIQDEKRDAYLTALKRSGQVKSFQDLSHLFPLFEADDPAFAGIGTCCVCQGHDLLCFSVELNTSVVSSCPYCESKNVFACDSVEDVSCFHCQKLVKHPLGDNDESDLIACYYCLRAGELSKPKDTEFGLIAWEQSRSGVTHGVPHLQQSQFESVLIDREENWIGVKLQRRSIFELLHTPTYTTWQGECWLFCCQTPMTFLGEWTPERFEERSPHGDGASFFYSVIEPREDGLWEGVGQGLCVYVFECKACRKVRANYDFD